MSTQRNGHWVEKVSQLVNLKDRVQIGPVIGDVVVIEYIDANSPDKHYVFGLDTAHGRVEVSARPGQVVKVWGG